MSAHPVPPAAKPPVEPSPAEPAGAPSPEDVTDFGFRDVPRTAKAGLVRDVFASVAPRYDLMNDLMSMGVHRLWKAALIDRLRPRPGMRLVDLAGGTGDVAFRFRAAGGGPVVVCDASAPMLSVGRDRALDRGLLAGIDWIAGEAERLPFPDHSFDACTIAFGLRNVTGIDAALAEARRVLVPGGHFLCLEFSRVALPFLDGLYDRYSFAVLPRLGAWIAGDVASYRYLVESIRRFPDQEALATRLRHAGFGNVGFQNLSGGIAALHVGWRI